MSEPIRPLPDFPHTFGDGCVNEFDQHGDSTTRDTTIAEDALLRALQRVVDHLERQLSGAPEADRDAVRRFREHRTEDDLCLSAVDLQYVRKWLGGTEFKVETNPAYVRDRVFGWKIWVGESNEFHRAKVRVVRPESES